MSEEIISHEGIGKLQVGSNIDNLGLKIDEILSSKDSELTLRCSDPNGNKRKLKIISTLTSLTKTASELENKLKDLCLKLNSSISGNSSALRLNLLDVAVLSDYIEGTNLESQLQSQNRLFSEDEVKDGLYKIVSELKKLHDAGIVHNDIKPQNIIFNNENYFLTDFGISRDVASEKTLTLSVRGTEGYIKPRAHSDGSFEKLGNHRIEDDFYALAKTAYFMLTRKHPVNIGVIEYDLENNKKMFSSLTKDQKLNDILFKLLGQNGRKFESCDEVLGELGKLTAKENNCLDLTVSENDIVSNNSNIAKIPNCIDGLFGDYELDDYDNLSIEHILFLHNKLLKTGYQYFRDGDNMLDDACDGIVDFLRYGTANYFSHKFYRKLDDGKFDCVRIDFKGPRKRRKKIDISYRHVINEVQVAGFFRSPVLTFFKIPIYSALGAVIAHFSDGPTMLNYIMIGSLTLAGAFTSYIEYYSTHDKVYHDKEALKLALTPIEKTEEQLRLEEQQMDYNVRIFKL